MQIPEAEGRLFCHLFGELMRFGNRRLQTVDDEDLDSNFARIPPETRMRIRDAVFQHPAVIDDFVRENPSHLTPEELAAVARWKNFVAGTFYVYRYLKQHTIFMGGKNGELAYGVLALADSIEVVLESWPLPAMVRTVLLPWRDKIIYDGLMWRYQILVDSDVRHRLDENYRRAREADAVITSLPCHPRKSTTPPTVRTTDRKTAASRGLKHVPAPRNGSHKSSSHKVASQKNGSSRARGAAKAHNAARKRQKSAR